MKSVFSELIEIRGIKAKNTRIRATTNRNWKLSQEMTRAPMSGDHIEKICGYEKNLLKDPPMLFLSVFLTKRMLSGIQKNAPS
ncbi:hypothetical protein, partial [Escherichia coli]|uniref:hypothetical protein n=1 Tax=Escherichia coli TaxID=562 RepID=UPI001BDCA057